MDNPADQPTPPGGAAEGTSFIYQMEQLILQQHSPLATLRLAAYAADAMRVLRLFEQHGNVSPLFDAALKKACPDWRNPGSIDDPADLIAVALVHVIASIQQLFSELAKMAEAMRASSNRA
jgi:hypothetical protein